MSRAIRADGLRQAVGLFNLLLGALFIVAPHRLDSPMYGGIGPYASSLGVALIVGGMALICANVLSLPRPFVVAAHVLAGVPLLLVSLGFATASFWPAAVTYLLAALGTVGVAIVPEGTNDHDPRPIRALAVTIAASAIVLSFVLIPTLIDPASASVPIAAGFFGLVLFVAGAAVLYTQLTRSGPTWLSNLTTMALGFVYVTFAVLVQVRVLSPTGILYFGLFGVALIALPLERRRRRPIDGSSFRSQLTVALLGITIIVITSTIAFLGDREERSTVAAQLLVNQALAEAMSANVTDYVRHHQQGLRALATVPNLTRMSREDQEALLRSTTRAYPDVVSFSTFKPSGEAIARGDGRALTDSTSEWIASAAAGVPDNLRATISSRVGRPVIIDATAVRDEQQADRRDPRRCPWSPRTLWTCSTGRRHLGFRRSSSIRPGP